MTDAEHAEAERAQRVFAALDRRELLFGDFGDMESATTDTPTPARPPAAASCDSV
jgi:hypothetical protein